MPQGAHISLRQAAPTRYAGRVRSWHSARLSRRQTVDDGLFLLELEVGAEVHRSFERPGQFQRVRHGGLEAMFAIGSSPGATRFEYLVRRGDGVSLALTDQPLGAPFELSTAEGPGFPLARAHGRDLLLVCTGTALAPLRSVLGLVARDRSRFGSVVLLQGQRSPRQLPWLGELEALPQITVHTTVDVPEPGWRGPVGQVQGVLDALQIGPSTVAFLVGQKEMTSEVTERLVARGVSPGSVFLNV